MYKNMKIKSQVVLIITVILTIVIFLQIVLYAVLLSKSAEIVASIFDEVAYSTRKQIENLNQDISEISDLLSYHSVVQDSLYKYTAPQIVNNLKKIQEVVAEYRMRNHNIVSMNIIKENALFASSETINLYNEINDLIIKYTHSTSPRRIFTSSFQKDGKTYFAHILPVYPLDIIDYTPVHAGNYIICIYEMKTIAYSPYPFIDNDKINVIITDTNNRILYSADANKHGTQFPAKDLKNALSKTFPISNTAWTATIFMHSEITTNLKDVSNLFITFMLIFNIIMLILMTRLLHGTIVKRLISVKDAIERIPTSGEEYSVSYEYQDEFSEIVKIVNHILRKANILNKEKIIAMDNLYKAQLLQKETQICYLYGQISPHFLYNSMSVIQGIAVKYNARDIVHLTSSLSKIFRYFSNNQNMSTIKHDLDYAIEYFNIVNMRRENPLTLKINVSEELADVRCLKMIYQPILENVLKHAFSLEESGTITIHSIPDNEKAIIEIADNGRGISDEILDRLNTDMAKSSTAQLQSSEHVGILNVHMRLKLFYDDPSGITITSSPNKGTVVRIIFSKDSNPLNIQSNITLESDQHDK